MNHDDLARDHGDLAITVDCVDERRVAAHTADVSFEGALNVLATAASSRIRDERLELERVALLRSALSAAREASGALQTWVAQSLSEYRGSHTNWDLHSTGERLGIALAQFQIAACDTALRLAVLLPEARPAGTESWLESSVPLAESLRDG